MKGLTFAILTGSIFLAGCASVHGLQEGLPYLEGRSIGDAIEILGFPDSQEQMDEHYIYTWESTVTLSGVAPVTSETKGTVGGDSVSASTTTYEAYGYDHDCRVRIITNSSRTIESWDWRGRPAACHRYSELLAEAFAL
jgi:uncharacterized protein YceK